MPNLPTSVVIRAYDVGFGDCLLVTFNYASRDRHVLIDFGSTKAPKSKAKKPNYMMDIATHISKVCNGKLDAVVATHRHRDHISGFATGTKSKPGPGDVIRGLKPDVVLQPWTEDPDAPAKALGPVNDPRPAVAGFRRTLTNMQAVAGDIEDYSARSGLRPVIKKQLAFLGETNLSNLAAVKNLQSMAKRHVYGYFGSKSGLDKLLPGVKTFVLGPPTLKQSDAIRKQTSKSADEFWHLYNSFSTFWSLQASTGRNLAGASPFPHARTQNVSSTHRWFIDRLRAMQDDSMLSIVRQLDRQMNNTSLILLFEVSGKRLLFPGDAQLENWTYALDTLEKSGDIEMLEEVDLYKVGHHGSLNATPKSLWRRFKKKGKTGRLTTVLSTRPGVHGSRSRRTEVPRDALLKELEARSKLFRTDTIRARDPDPCRTIRISIP